MAEISTLVASMYRQYGTVVPSSLLTISPAITSRFEIFWDERYEEYKVNQTRFSEGRAS
jgi:hypothetical protein